MKQNLKFVWKCVLVIVFVVASVCGEKKTVLAANDSIENATYIQFETVYNDSIVEDINKRYYKIIVPFSGKISLDIKGNNKYLYLRLYDYSKNLIDGKSYNKSSVSNELSIQDCYYLTGGTYYICLDGDYKVGDYQLCINYSLVKESFLETNKDLHNNDITHANKIVFNESYIGHIAHNDKIDFYCFTVPTSGKVNVSVEGENKIVYGRLYNVDGKELDSEYEALNSVTNKFSFTKEFHLAAGTYYYAVEGYNNVIRPGEYTIKLDFVSANESFGESQQDDYISGANPIVFNTTYYGQIALDKDEADYYKLVVQKKDRVQIDASADMYGQLYIYDANGTSIWYMNISQNEQLGKYAQSQIVTIHPGTYYLQVKPSSKTGNYSFKVTSYNETKKPNKVTLSKVKSSKKKTLFANWKKINNVNGYQIQYSTSKKFRNAKTKMVGSNTVKKTINKLVSKKKYYVRVRAYKVVVGKNKYGSWSKVKSVRVK